jgi:hypothetical protein
MTICTKESGGGKSSKEGNAKNSFSLFTIIFPPNQKVDNGLVPLSCQLRGVYAIETWYYQDA